MSFRCTLNCHEHTVWAFHASSTPIRVEHASCIISDHARDHVFQFVFTTIGNPPERLVGFARKLIEATVVGSYERPSTDELPLRCLTRINPIEQCVMRAYADRRRAGSSADLIKLSKRELSEAPSFQQQQRAHALALVGGARGWLLARHLRSTEVHFTAALAKCLEVDAALIEARETLVPRHAA